MCVQELLQKGTIVRVKAFNRHAEKVVDAPTVEKLDALLNSWQFVLVQYESGEIVKAILQVKDGQPTWEIRPRKDFLAG